MKANRVGFHTKLTPELHQKIIEAVSKVIIPSKVAALVKIPQQTLSDWLKRGENDANNSQQSIFAHLAIDFKYEQALLVSHLIQRLQDCPANYRSLVWLLERCFREDFGSDSSQIQELVNNINLINKYRNMPL